MALHSIPNDNQLLDLLQKLVIYYQDTLVMLPNDVPLIDIKIWLFKRDVGYGICYCSLALFELSLHNIPLIKSKAVLNEYWCRIPKFCRNREQVIEALQMRIQIMNVCIEELNNKINQPC